MNRIIYIPSIKIINWNAAGERRDGEHDVGAHAAVVAARAHAARAAPALALPALALPAAALAAAARRPRAPLRLPDLRHRLREGEGATVSF